MKRTASGILPIAQSDKTICLAWRSPEVQHGNRWGVIGGMLDDPHLDEADNAVCELVEEVGYVGPISLFPAYVHRLRGFSYHNFIGIVPEPFEFHPHPDHAWETTRIDWLPYSRIVVLIEAVPEMFHDGLLRLFKASSAQIQGFIR